MSMKGKPNWFKLDLDFKAIMEQIPDTKNESIGRALRAAMVYLETREDAPSLITEDPHAYSLYLNLRVRVDDAYKTYDSRVSNGNRGGRPSKIHKNRNKHLVTEEGEEESEKETEQDLSLLERKSNSAVLESYSSDDSLEAWRDIVSIIGEGVVTITDEDICVMRKFISMQNFRKYVRSVRNCIRNNKKYIHKTHAQAILEMADDDGKIIHQNKNSSFDTDEFFEAAIRRSLGYTEDNDEPTNNQ